MHIYNYIYNIYNICIQHPSAGGFPPPPGPFAGDQPQARPETMKNHGISCLC